MSWIELDEIPNPRKNLYPRFKDLEAQAFGYWLFKSLEQGNNDQEW